MVLVDKPRFLQRVCSDAASLGVQVSPDVGEGLFWLSSELLRWNSKVNLTAILDPNEVLDKHILDSLAVLPLLDPEARTLLDAGSGAGFPGVPIALLRPDLEVWLVDAVAKKVGFLKHVIAGLGLGARVHALQASLQGAPAREGVPPVDAAISRAFREVPRWAALARPYLPEGGQLLAMAGGALEPPALQGFGPPEVRRYTLPSGDGRTALAYRRTAEA